MPTAGIITGMVMIFVIARFAVASLFTLGRRFGESEPGEDISLAIEAPCAVPDDWNACAGPSLAFQKRYRALADPSDGFPREQSERVRLPKLALVIDDMNTRVGHFGPFLVDVVEIRRRQDYSGSRRAGHGG